jgi:tRNA threonylcarbamoyladenosine biosynthesis protein TsaB
LKILAVDTSTEYCSAALWIDGAVSTRETLAGQKHSELLLGMIDSLLRESRLVLGNLDGIAYGEGPGSFTGLRIACGVVQGLAFGADLPVVGVGTLLAMAAGSGAARVVVCVDARMNEVYLAAYQKTGEAQGEAEGALWREVHPPSVCPPHLAPRLAGADWHACGSGFGAYSESLLARYEGQLATVQPQHYPHAREVAALAAPRFSAGEGLGAERAAPVYIRDKGALRSDERPAR